MTDAITPETVLGHLADVDYPADKEALLTAAERAGAPAEVLKAIRAMPPVEYRSRAEVARSVRTDPGAGRDPGPAAAPARAADVRPRIAEHLRDP